MSLGGGEILVILLVALMVFGPQRMPEIARQLGKGMRELRKMQDSVRQELHGALSVDDHDGVGHGVPSYDDPHNGAPGTSSSGASHQTDSHWGEPPTMPPVDPPSAGSFN
ncbi:MAG TPA: twin-arginine translocase TatA/TatE family subunit [Acidimicrobiia bacterium]|jgi:Tat protein translocase TatB subunit